MLYFSRIQTHMFSKALTRKDLGICLSTLLNWDCLTIYRKLFVLVLLFNTYSYPMAFSSVGFPLVKQSI